MLDVVVRTLRNVRYIPSLKRNLISLRELDDSGLTYKAENCVIKVIKGSMVVIKRIKNHGLYEVISEIVIQNQPTRLIASGDDKSIKWHNRLGHISEKGLQILSKRGLLEGDQITNLEFCETCVLRKQH